MADIQIEGSASGTGNETFHPKSLVWVSSTTAYVFYINSGEDLVYQKTSNGGANWGGAQTIRTDTVESYSVWYDKWTEGDTGTKIHIAYADSGLDDYLYNSLDTFDDSLSGEVQITSIFSVSSSNSWTDDGADIVKAIGGNLYVALRATFTDDIYFYRSVDGGANWTSRAQLQDGIIGPTYLLPGYYADTNDIVALYHNVGGNIIYLMIYDNSADSWDDTGTGSISLVENTSYFSFDAAIRHSDNHIIVAAWNAINTSTGDLVVYDITNENTFTQKTNVVTNSESGGVSIMINQQNDEIYVAYIKPNTNFQATADIVYQKSTDGGANWGGETAMSANSPDDLRWISAGQYVGNAGGKFQPVWYNDDLSDIFTNTTNGVTINAGTAPVTSVIYHHLPLMGVGQ